MHNTVSVGHKLNFFLALKKETDVVGRIIQKQAPAYTNKQN